MRGFSTRGLSGSQVKDWRSGYIPISSRPVPLVLPFTPTSIQGLVSWYDASNSLTFTYSSGVLVSQWSDLSGSRHLAQVVTADQPSHSGSRGGLLTVTFAGDFLAFNTSSDTLNVGSVTIFMTVAYTTTSNNFGIICLHGTGGSDWDNTSAMAVETGGTGDALTMTRNNASSYVSGSRPVPWGQFSVVVRADGTSMIWRNGVTGALRANGGSSFGVANGGVVVGSRWLSGSVSAAHKISGDIGEIVIYNRALADDERQQVEVYLKTKWATP